MVVVPLVGLIMWATTELMAEFASRHIYLRAALLVAALGICFVYDDPASETTDPVPSSLLKRRSLRALLGLVAWGALFALISTVTGRGMDPVLILSEDVVNPFPVGRVLLEASTMAAWGLALAAVIARRWDHEPGKYASTSLVALYAVSWTVPDRWKPWADPSDPRWETALPYWWLALVIALVVALGFSWDARVGWRLPLGRREPVDQTPSHTVDSPA